MSRGAVINFGMHGLQHWLQTIDQGRWRCGCLGLKHREKAGHGS
jgi:hypothetical protein